MWRAADRLVWMVMAGVPIGLLAAGFAGYLRIATARRRRKTRTGGRNGRIIADLPKRRRLFGRAS